MNQGYFNNRIQVIHNKGKAIIIPKRGSIHELRYFMAELVAVNPIYIIRFVKERMEV